MALGLHRLWHWVGPAFAALAVLCAHPVAAATETAPSKKAAATKPKPKKKTVTESSGAVAAERAGTLGAFTPAMAPDSKAGAPALAASSGQAKDRSFRFTPSGKVGDRKALTVGVTTRVVKPRPETAVASREAGILTPTGYDFDLAVGYRGFAVSGGFSRLDAGYLAAREGVDLGLSYRGDRWKTALQLGADHAIDGSFDPLGLDQRYSVQLGGAYDLTPQLSVTGGVRYQILRDDALGSRIPGREAEDGAVFLGTAFTF